MKSSKGAKHKGRRVEALPCAETSSPAQMIERKEQPPARNRESRQTTTTTESGGGGLVSVFAPPYGEDEPPAFLIGTKTPKRGHEGRIIGTKGAKRGHENAGKASTPPKPRPRVVLSSWLSLHCKPAPLRAAGAKPQRPARRIAGAGHAKSGKNGLNFSPPETKQAGGAPFRFGRIFGRFVLC